jgi:PAS domain S-box-containing protein
MKHFSRVRNLRLSGKMVLFFIALVLCQSFISLTILTLIISTTNLQSLRTQMSYTLLSAEGYLNETFRDLRVKGELIAGQKKTIEYTDFELKTLLSRELILFKESLGIDSMAIFVSPDQLFASTQALRADDALYREQLERSFAGESRLFISVKDSQADLYVLSPIKRTDAVIGVLSLSLGMDQAFVSRIERIIGSSVVFRFQGTTIHGNAIPEREIESIFNAYARGAAENTVINTPGHIVGAIDLEKLGLLGGRIYCLLDTSQSARLIRRYNIISLVSTCLILSLALVSGIAFYQRTFSRRFQLILQGIRRISGGDFHPPFELDWKDEFGQLVGAFDDMCRKLLVREKELSQLSWYNSLILESVRSGIISIDLKGEITAFNSTAERILETGVKNPLGRSIDSIRLASNLTEFFMEPLARDSYPSGREITISRGDVMKILALSSSPLLSPDGARIGIIVIFEDITKVKSLEEKLALSSKLAALGEMAAGVAHQIRNPLVVMKVSAEMLRDAYTVEGDQERYQKLTNLMIDEADTLNLVVSNFLDFARPRAINSLPTPVESVIDFCLESLPLERFHGIAVSKIVQEDLSEHPMDKNLISQALSNLVLNALQASSSGSRVEVRAGLSDGRLRIEVQDWGEGMSDEVKRNMFNPFFTTRGSGTGLGLSIAHRIIDSHGGTIEVCSSPGKGSIFSILL